MTIPTLAMSKVKLRTLTKAALNRHYSPVTAHRLWELHKMGVSVGTLARARKALDGFNVTPQNDKEWSFFTDRETLEMWHQTSGTSIVVWAEGW